MPACRRLTFIALAALASGVSAAPGLHPLFTDHAVLQRGQPLRIWGDAAPGERVNVSLASSRAEARADRSGRWLAELPALPAGGPHRLEARFERGALAAADDVLIGDVWLCSGQSNMELPVSRALNPDTELGSAGDAELRLLGIAQQIALDPAAGFAKAPSWAPATRSSVAPFSAACYFMGRELRKSEGVPIGLINASWGGTAIRSWLDPEAARRASGGDRALLDLYKRDPAAANRSFGERWQAWWAERQPTRPWQDSSALDWRPMKATFWEQWGDPAFVDFNGMVWARTRVTLTAAEAAQTASLSLGVIDELDQVWVNGIAVGNTYGWDNPRTYAVPAGLLRAGENEILVNINDGAGAGGFAGPASELVLRLADGGAKPLPPRLEYSVAPPGRGEPPRPPWDRAAGMSLVYNGMVAPLGPAALKGVAWYQGETDGGMAAGYSDRLAAMIAGWRSQFRSPALPFLVVGLPQWGPPPTQPSVSGWAEVRDAQRRVATADRNAAFVAAIDTGDRLELHPPQKQEVGRRLARAAGALVYGKPHPASGPQPLAARRAGDDVVVSFTGVTGALRSWSGAPIGFELCGDGQQSCRFATAIIEGPSVRLNGDGRPVTRVRFAWADAPVVNLFDEVPLPVSSFELPVP